MSVSVKFYELDTHNTKFLFYKIKKLLIYIYNIRQFIYLFNFFKIFPLIFC